MALIPSGANEMLQAFLDPLNMCKFVKYKKSYTTIMTVMLSDGKNTSIVRKGSQTKNHSTTRENYCRRNKYQETQVVMSKFQLCSLEILQKDWTEQKQQVRNGQTHSQMQTHTQQV